MALVQCLFKVSLGDREFLEKGSECFCGSGGFVLKCTSVVFQKTKKMMMVFIFICLLIYIFKRTVFKFFIVLVKI